MDIFYSIVNFFARGGVFMYPILFVAAVAAAIAIERYVTLTRLSIKNRARGRSIEPVLTEGDFDKAREATAKDDTAVSQLHGGRSCAPRRGATRRRRREGDAHEPDGADPAVREAHALSRYVREPRHAARPARHGERSDSRLHGGRDSESRGEGESARRQHFRGDELYGLRPDGRRASAFHSRIPADEDRRAHQQSRNCRDEVPDAGRRSSVGAHAEPPRAGAACRKIMPRAANA